ncbi:MAG: SLC13/DASS family transporter [Bacteroidales bacterium]|nr:SLC13/DASS family transporter [Bacteroidales bacterium]
MGTRQITGFFLGLGVFLAVLLFMRLDPGHPDTTNTLAVALLMAVWWVTEVIPLGVTALLPVLLFPVMGILGGGDVAASYFNDVIFLFLGGFLIALAMQRWNLHRRIALKILSLTGLLPSRLLLGFMLASAFLSMWISNTATAMMMLPIVISVLDQMEEHSGGVAIQRYATGMLLGIAYSASIGGIATLVGTPPNMAFAQIFRITFPNAPEVSFSQWLIFAGPVSAFMLVVVWFYLYCVFFRKGTKIPLDAKVLHNQLSELGSMRGPERIVLIDFIAFALLLIFRADISLGEWVIPGWSRLLPEAAYVGDGTVAIASGLILFLIPAGNNQRVMMWEEAHRIPWQIILLFGGGFALADGFVSSGLSAWIGTGMEGLISLHPLVVTTVVCAVMIFLTELTSNTATTQMLLPVLAAIAVSARINPLLLMLPATLAASMAFMLPVATPPNAVIFGTDRIKITDMARTGFWMNLTGIIVVTMATWILGRLFFGIHPDELPAWMHF